MRNKTRYIRKPETPAVAAAISEPEPKAQPEPDYSVAPIEPKAEPQPPPAAEEDAATRALKSHIAEIERSAALNRQRQVEVEKLALANNLFQIWKHDGLTPKEETLLITVGLGLSADWPLTCWLLVCPRARRARFS